MKIGNIKIFVLLIAAIISMIIAAWPIRVVSGAEAQTIQATSSSTVASSTLATSTGPTLSYAQNLWISALEYCESQGNPKAVNWHDTDGTPSYYSFQFKPGTFINFGVRYGVLEKGLSTAKYMELMKDTTLQRQIVSYMILDKTVKIQNQFPGCVRKFGRPPSV